MFFLKYLINYLRRYYRVEHGLEYVEALRNLNRPSEVTIPNELIPAGVLMQLRGLLNLHVLSVNSDWVWPYWMERQSDPHDSSFIPRAMNVTYLNLTHRNWTAVGVLGGQREAIVDPRGAVTPWPNGWSLDTWLEVDQQLRFPSRLPDTQVSQELVEGIPWIRTTMKFPAATLVTEDWAVSVEGRACIVHLATLTNQTSSPLPCSLIFALRPTNPEGISIIKRLAYHTQGFLLVEDQLAVALIEKPAKWLLSTHRDGDVAHLFPRRSKSDPIVHCPVGLANACVSYPTTLQPGQSMSRIAVMPLEPTHPRFFPLQTVRGEHLLMTREDTRREWSEKLARGLQIEVPDARYQQCFNANKAFLLLLNDGYEITAGPFTYHRHWFRDAAYMLSALSRLGYHQEVAQVLSFYPLKQWKNGYFCSQKGEWDSTGQAIWSIMEHYRLTGDVNCLRDLYPAVRRGAIWIEKKRHDVTVSKTKPRGLMPAGFSAEHLGPNDHYYWDNFWSLKGLEDALEAARVLGIREDAEKFQSWAESYRRDILHAIQKDIEHSEVHALPAAPGRPPDAGMIGNICAAYPLQLFSITETQWLRRTLEFIRNHLFHGDGFYQEMIHSGINSYLTMQVAQCLVQLKDEEAFRLIDYMLELASPTWCWPEAIHPRTLGGCMGDGHHGWAAAEWLLLMRGLLIEEADDELHLTRLLPKSWTCPGQSVSLQNAPTYFGKVQLRVEFFKGYSRINFDADWRVPPRRVIWHLPARPVSVRDTETPVTLLTDGIAFCGERVSLEVQLEPTGRPDDAASEHPKIGVEEMPHRPPLRE
ncbi:MAG: hypothetical protein D6691_01695 [Candidatus Hydrogenedentota bacterium]|uniref:Discoidin domain protein n=1 Tax=Sumerlaea chitinivorans TaxID=2250252 RepID=A0A2Z4Y481_SUMC1|nr:Discoidin domain protein [Candidatus Sumerlaea chitinivorans]RMH30176.1 MAG: hypothetical protein D6691_01695 [Candidatus Hydrogenedentota bacterium]